MTDQEQQELGKTLWNIANTLRGAMNADDFRDYIRDIVETYQFRKEENRYSRRVEMDEIEEKGFNLNIARYVSIAEAEKEIDLTKTNLRLKGLEEKISAAKMAHNAFLQELGLPELP